MDIKKTKNKVKSWCRYWHFNVLGLVTDNDGHRNYLDITYTLNDWHDMDVWENDEIELEQVWKNVLSAINKCSDDQILELSRFCKSRD